MQEREIKKLCVEKHILANGLTLFGLNAIRNVKQYRI